MSDTPRTDAKERESEHIGGTVHAHYGWNGSVPNTNVKPATALPWVKGDFNIYDATEEICIASCEPQSFGEPQPEAIAEQNNAYLFHAANAYPRLVAALQTLITADREGELCNDQFAEAIDVLRELGESVSPQENAKAK